MVLLLNIHCLDAIIMVKGSLEDSLILYLKPWFFKFQQFIAYLYSAQIRHIFVCYNPFETRDNMHQDQVFNLIIIIINSQNNWKL